MCLCYHSTNPEAVISEQEQEQLQEMRNRSSKIEGEMEELVGNVGMRSYRKGV